MVYRGQRLLSSLEGRPSLTGTNIPIYYSYIFKVTGHDHNLLLLYYIIIIGNDLFQLIKWKQILLGLAEGVDTELHTKDTQVLQSIISLPEGAEIQSIQTLAYSQIGKYEFNI